MLLKSEFKEVKNFNVFTKRVWCFQTLHISFKWLKIYSTQRNSTLGSAPNERLNMSNEIKY